MTTSQKSASDDQTTTETTLDQFSTSQDDEPDVATDGGQVLDDQDVDETDDELDEPIKIQWTGDARQKFKTRKVRARYDDGNKEGERAYATLDRLKTRVVVETRAEAEALKDLLKTQRRAGYRWQTKQHKKSYTRVLDELTEAMQELDDSPEQDDDDDTADDQDDDQPAAEFVGAPEGRATGFRYETPDGDAVEIRKTGRESARVLNGAENLTDDVREAIARDRGILNFDTDADAVAADGGDDADQDDEKSRPFPELDDQDDDRARLFPDDDQDDSDDQDEPEVDPDDVVEPTEPDDIAQYILDGLDRQDPTELREIAEYADALADYRDAQIEAEAPTPEDPDRLADAVDELDQVDSSDDDQQQKRQKLLFEAWDAGGTVQRKEIPCGQDCDGCPHGPYVYLTYREGDTVRSKYLGKPENYGLGGESAETDDQDDSSDDEPATESVDLAEFVDEWDDADVATDGAGRYE